ncbi:MAG: hypothetical protein JHD10_04305 [Sphingomonadaceae bacterium]|nr:hypothetical protein [Sphingomonadaceae bacterium]
MHTQIDATKRCQLLAHCFPDGEYGAGKQISRHRDLHNIMKYKEKMEQSKGFETSTPTLATLGLQLDWKNEYSLSIFPL